MKKQELEDELNKTKNELNALKEQFKNELIALEEQIKKEGKEHVNKAHNCRLLKQTYSEGWHLGENAYAQILSFRIHNILKRFDK